MVNSQSRTLRQFDGQFELTPHRLDIAAKRREIHVGLLLNFRDRRLLDIERGGDIGLGLTRYLAQLAQAFDLLLELLIARIDRDLLPRRQRCDEVESTVRVDGKQSAFAISFL